MKKHCGLPKTWRGVTVRQLFNQTSGIPEWNLDLNEDLLLKTYTLVEISARATATSLAFMPGTRYEYSNTNYNLLAGIIEKVSGTPYGDLLHTRIFGPLGMNAPGVYDLVQVIANRATRYVRSGGRFFNNAPFMTRPSSLLVEQSPAHLPRRRHQCPQVLRQGGGRIDGYTRSQVQAVP